MKSGRDTRIGLLFAAPWILGFSVFLAYPIIASLYFSFTSYSVLKPPVWVGFANYQELAGDEVFRTGLWNTFLYLIGAVPLMTILAIALALLLNMKVKGMAFYRTLFFVPTLVPMVAQGTLFLWVFNGDHGRRYVVRQFLQRNGFAARLAAVGHQLAVGGEHLDVGRSLRNGPGVG